MPDLDDRTLLAALAPHVGAARAHSVLARVRRETAGHRGPVPPRQLVSRIADALRVHLGDAATSRAVADLNRLVAGDPPATVELELRFESDIARARAAARDLCQALGTSPLIVQKLATIVSELARNIIAYAGGGTLVVRRCPDDRRCVHIAASDRGPGISNLEDILAGRYKSRSGLGLGILGTKRLADRFTIESNPGGTRVEVELSY